MSAHTLLAMYMCKVVASSPCGTVPPLLAHLLFMFSFVANIGEH